MINKVHDHSCNYTDHIIDSTYSSTIKGLTTTIIVNTLYSDNKCLENAIIMQLLQLQRLIMVLPLPTRLILHFLFLLRSRMV